MLPSQILPLLTVPGTDEAPRLVEEARAGGEAFSGWLLDRRRNAVARLLNFRFRFTQFDPSAETAAAFRSHLIAELPEEPAPVALPLDDSRLERRGRWETRQRGLAGTAEPGTRLSFFSDAPKVTLRFVTSPDHGIVQLSADDGDVQELDLYTPTHGRSLDAVVHNPGHGRFELALVPTGRKAPEARQAQVILAGIWEHTGPLGPVRPLPRLMLGMTNPPVLAPFPPLLDALGAEDWALTIGNGPGRLAHPRCLHLDWLAYEGADLLADPQALPFRSNSLALVHAHGALNRVADPARFLAELRRVLKPGGQAVLGTTPDRWRRFGGPPPIEYSAEGLTRLLQGFTKAHVEATGGLAERVETELTERGVQRRAGSRLAAVVAELAALEALSPEPRQPHQLVAVVQK